MNNRLGYLSILFLTFCLRCKHEARIEETPLQKEDIDEYLKISLDILSYTGTPTHNKDKEMLMFSDQGAWFAYSIPDSITKGQGFSGPFLMTQENGVWSSAMLSQILIKIDQNEPVANVAQSLGRFGFANADHIQSLLADTVGQRGKVAVRRD